MAFMRITSPRWRAIFRHSLPRNNRFYHSEPQRSFDIVTWGFGNKSMTYYKRYESVEETEDANGPSFAQVGPKILSMGIPNRAPIAAGAFHFLIGFTYDNGCGFLSGGLSNSHGQLGNGNRIKKESTPLVTVQNLEMLALSCGFEHSMVLAREKETQSDSLGWRLFSSLSSSLLPQTAARTRLYAFGSSEYGQLGLGDCRDGQPNESSDQMGSEPMCQPFPTMVELPDLDENVIQVQCGLLHTVLLTDQGNLYAMGHGQQLGLGPDSTSNRAVPTLIERLSWKAQGKEFGRVKQISSSSGFTLALLENNQVWIWGATPDGQSMINRRTGWILEPMHVPHPIPETETIVSVAAGGTFALLLTESGKVYTCGAGVLGLGPEKTQVLMPEHITSLSGITKIVASTFHAGAIDDKGHLYTWGQCGDTGRLGHQMFGDCYEPKRVVMKDELNGHKVIVTDVALGIGGGVARFERA